ncbi:ER-golgi trafficking TRAPP I complex 85 kDa subunit-domain-containing protein [Schizophyllum amplum]|uniref:ER-golgi trafficking TRAPP I complex 85 kDa subunit-domain-containing protein n=1 Tax=Schizophyllum amplum TaxID=97359 RepID=A0A550CNP8_9AGAR|nr:ER-golgi trafficking TRAPP I complex 85 kDa subunit-domain-containing protein [Auriculariopsis ampla]
MAPVLLSSLSPHICILPSPDLVDLLDASSLPDLPTILQSFSPLPQVTTRTSTLTPVPHVSFALRFSDLRDIEEACKEDEDRRAMRTLDWIGGRINAQCKTWVDEAAKSAPGMKEPWWDELRRCTEGDNVPDKTECWNHPSAIMLAVSTNTANPLQAIAMLHSRAIDLPPWVDPACLKYTLIVHTSTSSLNDEEAEALYNAVKKQYGLHSYLLSLTMPSPPPDPVPVPALLPRLPRPSDEGSKPEPPTLNSLRLCETDIQTTARFTREFVVMSLVPWMEQRVMEWNENFVSARRLPSRLFSSTRRLFGSGPVSPAPAPPLHHAGSSSVSYTLHRSSTYAGGPINPVAGLATPPPQPRRLAEFATILGDFNSPWWLGALVTSAMCGRLTSTQDILPLLLTPSPSLAGYASTSLTALTNTPLPSAEIPARVQVKALAYAVRWAVGIDPADFSSDVLEGERWLAWASGDVPHLSAFKRRDPKLRRAGLWYVFAAKRLEKCGIRPLTIHFLRMAHELFGTPPPYANMLTLSPSFWDSENVSAPSLSSKPSGEQITGLEEMMTGIEQPLGRLLYTSGEVVAAIELFLSLLQLTVKVNLTTPTWRLADIPTTNGTVDGEKVPTPPEGKDKSFLDDFRVAYSHYLSTLSSPDASELNVELPFRFSQARETKVRVPGKSSGGKAGDDAWTAKEETWKAFAKKQGLPTPKGYLIQCDDNAPIVAETFWVDVALRNPLEAHVVLNNLTLKFGDETVPGTVDVETLDEIQLGPRENRTIPIAVTAHAPASLTFAYVTYTFLSLLPAREPLTYRGARLHATAAQRQNPTYAPDITLKAAVRDRAHRLRACFADDTEGHTLLLSEGEVRHLTLRFTNEGVQPVGELWIVPSERDEDDVWWADVTAGSDANDEATSDAEGEQEVLRSDNSLLPTPPMRVALRNAAGDVVLQPGESMDLPLTLHAANVGERELSLLFVYRENESESFYPTRLARYYDVRRAFLASMQARPSSTYDHLFFVDISVESRSPSTVHVTQVTTMSPTWQLLPLVRNVDVVMAPRQKTRFMFAADPWEGQSGSRETRAFVKQKLKGLIVGDELNESSPPPIDLLCCHSSLANQRRTPLSPALKHLVLAGRRKLISQSNATSFPHIPSRTHPYIFPLHNPSSVDAVLFWTMPSQQRSGHILVSGLRMGASHAPLRNIVEAAESAKVKRSMYAETQRERAECSSLPLRIPVPFVVRNFSQTHTCAFSLKFTSTTGVYPPLAQIQPPPYTGRLTFRGRLEPCQRTNVTPSLWITRPGTYSLGHWRAETEVFEQENDVPSTDGVPAVRHRYLQTPAPEDDVCFTVSDVHR